MRWSGDIHAGWINLRFETARSWLMRMTLYLDLDGDGRVQPATPQDAARMVYLRDQGVNPRNNPFVIAAPGGAGSNLVPDMNFRMGTGTMTRYILTYSIENLER